MYPSRQLSTCISHSYHFQEVGVQAPPVGASLASPDFPPGWLPGCACGSLMTTPEEHRYSRADLSAHSLLCFKAPSISTPTTPATLRGCSWTASSPSSQGSGQDARCCVLVVSCPIAVCPLSFHRSSKKPRKDLEKERSRHHPTPGSAPLPFLDRVSSSDTWPLFCFGCHVRSSRLEGITSGMDLRRGYILCLASAPGCHIVCSTKIGWDGEARSTCMWIDNVP